MSKLISYSAWDKYLTCPKMYDIHYNERLRPSGTSSALVFGSAMDEALNSHLLHGGNLEKTIQVFRDSFDFKNMKDVYWDDRDIDALLIDSKKFTNLKELAWACMRVKGRLLIEKYHRNIYPLIEEVYSVQKNLHSRPGVLDAVVKLRGYGRVLLDHKTSARPYDQDAVAHSTQLALYARDQKIEVAGFVVLVKQIRHNTKRLCVSCGFNGSHVRHKTCPEIINGTRCGCAWNESHNPEAQIQLIVNNVPAINGELVESSISEVEAAIDLKLFPRNLKACGKIYGAPCKYIDYCWKKSKTGLEYKEEVKPQTKENK